MIKKLRQEVLEWWYEEGEPHWMDYVCLAILFAVAFGLGAWAF